MESLLNKLEHGDTIKVTYIEDGAEQTETGTVSAISADGTFEYETEAAHPVRTVDITNKRLNDYYYGDQTTGKWETWALKDIKRL